MKYVIVEVGGIETPIIFDPIIQHSDFKARNPISAGFFELKEENRAEQYDAWGGVDFVPKVRVFGKSVSLDIDSRPEDAILIERALSHIE
jgi:hypothetical protein